MARLVLAIAAMAIWAFLVPAFVAADSSSSPPSGCDDVIPDMADCLPYVTDGSNVSSPGMGCCMGIKQVVAKSPLCLCEALKEASQFNISVNMTRALGLPNLCKLNVPPISACNATSPPGEAPAPPSPPPKSPSVPSPTPVTPLPTPVSPPPTAPPVSPAQPPVVPAQAPLSSSTAELKISHRLITGMLPFATFFSWWMF